MNRIKDFFDSLSSEKKSQAIKYGSIGALVAVLLATYYLTGKPNQSIQEPEAKKLNFSTQYLEDDIRASIQKDLVHQTQTIDEQNKRIKALEGLLSEIKENDANAHQSIKQSKSDELPQASEHPLTSFPPPPAYSSYQNNYSDLDDVPEAEPQLIGGITKTPGKQEKKLPTKKKKTVYLPPSFMDAVLLTGIEALTTQGAMSNPEPIMIRVQAPAVLPNSVKADLQGCFVIANAFGVLAKERVDARVVNLSCMSLEGKAVIDQEVKGYVVDSDGKKGLAGRVVSKMGANVARSILAGIFEGFGSAISLAQTQTTINPLGATKVLDEDKAIKSGLGQGLQKGTAEIQKLFLDLAKQTAPVVEIGATKKLTVVIQEGVELEIKAHETYEG